MGSEKRWRQVGGGGQFQKWEAEGQVVEGEWLGQRDGQYGALGSVRTREGTVSFPIQTALVDKVAGFKDGDTIRIVYTGKQPTKDGKRSYKAFDVFVMADGDGPDPDDEAPF